MRVVRDVGSGVRIERIKSNPSSTYLLFFSRSFGEISPMEFRKSKNNGRLNKNPMDRVSIGILLLVNDSWDRLLSWEVLKSERGECPTLIPKFPINFSGGEQGYCEPTLNPAF